MNINILKEFKLIFFNKNLINIIFSHIYINYTFKIILIPIFLPILSIFLKNSKYFHEFWIIFFIDIFIKIFIDIFNIFVKFKYRYPCLLIF